MDLFKKATQIKLRFKAVNGLITSEDLYDIPLESDKNTSLESLAQAANKKVKECQEESFVNTKSKGFNQDVLRLEILKIVIADRLAANKKAASAVANKQEKAKLLDLLAQKQDSAFTPAQIKARLKALEEDE
jgi:protein tyrosine/serine phosphatase